MKILTINVTKKVVECTMV